MPMSRKPIFKRHYNRINGNLQSFVTLCCWSLCSNVVNDNTVVYINENVKDGFLYQENNIKWAKKFVWISGNFICPSNVMIDQFLSISLEWNGCRWTALRGFEKIFISNLVFITPDTMLILYLKPLARWHTPNGTLVFTVLLSILYILKKLHAYIIDECQTLSELITRSDFKTDFWNKILSHAIDLWGNVSSHR